MSTLPTMAAGAPPPAGGNIAAARCLRCSGVSPWLENLSSENGLGPTAAEESPEGSSSTLCFAIILPLSEPGTPTSRSHVDRTWFKSSPNFVEIGQGWPKVGRIPANVVHFGRTVVDIGQVWMITAQIWSNSGCVAAEFCQNGERKTPIVSEMPMLPQIPKNSAADEVGSPEPEIDTLMRTGQHSK